MLTLIVVDECDYEKVKSSVDLETHGFMVIPDDCKPYEYEKVASAADEGGYEGGSDDEWGEGREGGEYNIENFFARRDTPIFRCIIKTVGLYKVEPIYSKVLLKSRVHSSSLMVFLALNFTYWIENVKFSDIDG